jgi:hypothetical protein
MDTDKTSVDDAKTFAVTTKQPKLPSWVTTRKKKQDESLSVVWDAPPQCVAQDVTAFRSGNLDAAAVEVLAADGGTRLSTCARLSAAGQLPVGSVPCFLTSLECKELIGQAERQGMVRSMTTGGTSDPFSYSPTRTSMSTASYPSSALWSAVQGRMASFFDCKVSDLEDGTISSYVPGQEFKPHFDSSPAVGVCRRTTALVYLCNVSPDTCSDSSDEPAAAAAAAGGATFFTRLGLRVYPREGMLLFWDNHNALKTGYHLDSEHAGESPLTGKKWIAQCFVKGL